MHISKNEVAQLRATNEKLFNGDVLKQLGPEGGGCTPPYSRVVIFLFAFCCLLFAIFVSYHLFWVLSQPNWFFWRLYAICCVLWVEFACCWNELFFSKWFIIRYLGFFWFLNICCFYFLFVVFLLFLFCFYFCLFCYYSLFLFLYLISFVFVFFLL